MDRAARHALFGVDPNEFIAERDQLVRELRATGEKGDAAAVKALRRPTIPMWALNQVSRTDSDALGALVDASRAARTAQDQVLGGAEGSVLREAVARRREAAATVVAAARRVIDASGRSSDAHARDLENVLNTIVGSELLTARLHDGELVTIESDDGGESAGLLGSLSVSVPPRARQPARSAKSAPWVQLCKAQEKLARHRGEADSAATQLRAAEQAVTEAESGVTRAERELASARRARDAAARIAGRARHAVARSEDAVRDLEG